MNRPKGQPQAEDGDAIPDIADKNINIEKVAVKNSKPMTIKLG